MFDDFKNVFASKTVWGAALAVAGSVASLFHLNFGAVDQATTIDAIWQISAGIGGLLAVWGRVTATKKIG